MQGKFRFSLDGVDASARQFAEVRRQLRELSASVGESVSRLGERVTGVERDFESLVTEQSRSDVGESDAVAVPAHGGTGVRNAFDNPLSLTPRKPVHCLYDDAQPVAGLSAEDLDDAGLGSFCESDSDGVPTGVDCPKLSVAALRLAQQAMGEVDELRDEVARLSSVVGKMGVSPSE